jgi:hypothetical protein
MSRTMLAVLWLLLLATSLMAQGPNIMDNEFKKARVTVFEVSQFQTAPLERAIGVEYVMDFQAISKRALSKDEIAEVKVALADSANYIAGMTRSCPFIGKYGIRIENRSSVTEIIISQETCPKMIFRSGTQEQVTYFDLAKNNSLHKILQQLISGP